MAVWIVNCGSKATGTDRNGSYSPSFKTMENVSAIMKAIIDFKGLTWLGAFYKIAIAVSPAVFVLVLTMVTGAIGVFGLFHTNLPMDALTDLLGIIMVLYPSYVFFAVLHHEFIARRSLVLSERLQLKRVQTTISQI
jgi:hypothetical protein